MNQQTDNSIRLPVKILNGIKDAFVALDKQECFVYLNDEAEKILKQSKESLLGKPVWTILTDEQIARIKEKVQITNSDHENYYEFEFFYERTDCWYEIRAYCQDDGVSIFFMDISHRKMQENNLRESEKRYRSLVEFSPETISLHDGEKFIYINPAGVKLFHANTQKELIGSSLWSLIDPNDHAIVRATYSNLIEQKKKMIAIEHRIVTKKSVSIDVEATSTLINYHGSPIIRTIFKDISERKKIDEIIRKSDKLSVVAQLAAGVAHEIRNPLTAIKGFLQIFQKNKEFNERYLHIVMNELERVESIIYEYLTLANPNHEAKFERIKIKEILEQVITLTTTQAILKNIVFRTTFKEVPDIYGEEKQLKQVFINIIQNAIEAVEKSGEITIALFPSNAKEVIIKITDNGCGIPQERIDRLGEPFYSTKEKGTGLGLMICYKIITNHGGEIEIFSEDGVGTTVQVRLPIK